jgi:signal transduction histidine kinase
VSEVAVDSGRDDSPPVTVPPPVRATPEGDGPSAVAAVPFTTELAERLRQAELSAAIGVALTNGESLRDQLQRCSQALVDYLDAAFARIWTLNEAEQILELQASAGLYTHLGGRHGRVPVGAFKIGRIAQLRMPHLTNTVSEDPHVSDKEWARREGMVAFAGYPLLVGEDLVGVMGLFARQMLTTATIQALESVGSSIALGIARARVVTDAEAERARLQGLLLQAPAAICFLRGPEHIYEYANHRYLALVGNRPVLGKPLREALPELVAQGFHDLLDQVFRTGDPYTGTEVPVLLDRGGPEPVVSVLNFVYQPIRDRVGRVDGILVHAAEVTEAVRAREQVVQFAREAEAERRRLQQVLDVLPEGVVLADAQARRVLTNAAAREILGTDQIRASPAVDAQEATARYHTQHLDGTPFGPEEGLLYRSVFGGEVVRGEQVLVRYGGEGHDVPLLANSAPLRDEAGAIAGGVMTFQDISAIRDLERQKDEFLATISHDLKNPLTTIQGTSQLLMRRARRLPEDQGKRFTEGLETLILTARQMAAQIAELLDLTRLQMARPLDLDIQPTELVALAERVVSRYRQATERHTVRLETVLPTLVCRCDGARLERVLANLLSNAIKYSPHGGTIATTLDVTEDEWATIEVIDQGVGIPVEEQPRIFERFYRASNVVGRFAGSGMGLAGARQLVELHGGTMRLASTPGAGTTITLRLRLAGPLES